MIAHANRFKQLYISDEPQKRSLTGGVAVIAVILSIIIALVHLYNAYALEIAGIPRNAWHFSGFALLCSIVYPLSKKQAYIDSRVGLIFDSIFGLLVAGAAAYIASHYDHLTSQNIANNLDFTTLDWLAGILVIVGAIELTRRSAGWVIPILIILSLSYLTWLGPMITGTLNFAGMSTARVLLRSITGDYALFGKVASISATYVFLFIIFGAFLVRSGAGDFVINLARAVAGRFIGGPGLIAVIASGLTGTISGSAIANTASTGVITIPLMKRAGFPSRFAAAVEASASTGGQLMPPIMGAGAFVMASNTQISYTTIIAVAALPALLYFLSVGFFVRIEAKKQGLRQTTENNYAIKKAIIDSGASFIIPIVLLIGLLASGFTPTYAAIAGIFAIVISSYLTKTPMGFSATLEALAMGSRGMIMTAVLLSSIGLVVNAITTSGIGNTFSLMIMKWSAGNLTIAIVLIGLASLVLGAGLPVTAAYIVLATLSAPALANMIVDKQLIEIVSDGKVPETARAMFMLANPDILPKLSAPMSLPSAANLIHSLPPEILGPIRDQVVPAAMLTTALLSAHMIIFWLSQDSNITPPVALAAFTAAAIAKSPPMKTGFTSWKIAKGLYIIPLLFAYTPFLSDNWLDVVRIFVFAAFGIYAIAGAIEGYMENPISPLQRLLTLAAGIACLWPVFWINIIALAATLALLWLNLSQVPKNQRCIR